jgi:hypothetical protein
MLDILTRKWLIFWLTWFELRSRAKNELKMQKSEKLNNFGHKQSGTVPALWRQFSKHFNWCPLLFFLCFFAKQHQAIMYIYLLQEILFGIFAVAFAGHFPKLTKTVFLLTFFSFLRDLCVLTAQFSPFPSKAAL